MPTDQRSLDDLLGVTGPERRSMENPRKPLDPWSQAFGENVDGSLSASGIRVNREKALTLGAFWRAVNLISGTVAKLPLGVYRKADPVGIELDPRQPAHRLLRREPNEAMTAFTFKQTLQAHATIHGNGYAYIVRRADGSPCELWPLDPERTYPVRECGKLWFVHELSGSGEKRKLPHCDVLHVMGLSHDGLEGYGLLSKMKEAAGGALAMQAFTNVFYRNNARPNVVLQHPGRLNAEARRNLREGWERMYSGLDNAHRVAVLEEGVSAQAMSINAGEAQLIESKQFSLTDLANWTNLPPHKLGAMTNVSYGSLEQENQAFLDDAIDPWLVRWEEQCELKLLSSYQRARETHCISFDRFPLVRADLQQRGEYYVKAITTGWMSPDEARAREGLNPIPGGAGRAYFFPLNVQPYGIDPDGPDGPAVAPGTELLAVPGLRQEGDYDCGPAAVQAVCRFFGVGPAARADYIDALDTTKREGTRPSAVLSYLSRLDGLVTTAAGGLTVADLGRFFAAGQPVLCPIQSPSPGGGPTVGHWVTVIGTGLGMVFVQDPAAGQTMHTEEDWLDRWADRDADGVSYERYGIAVGRELMAAPITTGGSGGGEGNDRQARLTATVRDVLLDAVTRMVRRVRHAAERAATGGVGRFAAWLQRTMRADHGDAVESSLRLPLAAWEEATGRTGDRLPGGLLDDLHTRLCRAMEGCEDAARLGVAVSQVFERLETGVDTLSCVETITTES